MSRFHESKTTEEREFIQQEITETALQHHLVSRYTSLLAVDVTPVNANGMLYQQRLKNNLPYGWKSVAADNGIMLAQTDAGSVTNMLLGGFLLICAVLMYLFCFPVWVFSERSGIAE